MTIVAAVAQYAPTDNKKNNLDTIDILKNLLMDQV